MNKIQKISTHLKNDLIFFPVLLILITLAFILFSPKTSSLLFSFKRQTILSEFINKTKNNGINPQEYWKFREFYSPGYFNFSKDGINNPLLKQTKEKVGVKYNDKNIDLTFLVFSSPRTSSLDMLTNQTYWGSQRGRRKVTLAMVAALGGLLAGCGTALPPADVRPPQHIDITLIGFNDLHGNLEPPRMAHTVQTAAGPVSVPAGGMAYFASAMAALKARGPHHAVVSAGDMVGASPLLSSLFLDEPTIEAVNAMQIDFNAVGNHEFDRGWRELLRLQHGGCEKFTARQPCQISQPFVGARFGFLAANTVRTEDGRTLLPATGIKRFTEGGVTVTLGVIGLTLQATPTMVSPSGVAGLRFEDEAATANALIPQLRAQGADVIAVGT